MSGIEVTGTVELQAQVFAECPEYTTLGLRTVEGDFLEVFLSTGMVENNQNCFRLGQVLKFAGGEWYIEPGSDGVGEHRRYWPEDFSDQK